MGFCRISNIATNDKHDNEVNMNIAKMIHTYITDEAVEQKVIQAMNDAVDIPFINEKTEEKIAKAIWATVSDVLKKVLEGK